MKSASIKFILSCMVLFAYALKINAQELKQKTGDVGDEQVTVVKAYQPTLSDAIKISDVPQKDETIFTVPDLEYNIESKKLESKYNITPIKPVKIKDENIKKLYRGFVKAGYGNYNTPYGEIFYNALRSKEFDAGIHFKHLSSSGSISGFGFPGFSENQLELFGKKYFENAVLSANIDYNRNAVHYYGYNPVTDGLQSKSSTLHRMGIFDADFSLASSHNDKDKLDYKAGLGFYGYSDNVEQSETDFVIGGMIGKHLSSDNYLKADLTIDISSSEFPPPVTLNQGAINPIRANRTIFRINPRYEFTKNGILISAGGNVAIESAYDETHYHLYPFINIKYPLIKEEFSVFGQLSGELRKNSIRSLNKENPFLTPSPVAANNVLINTNNKFDLRGGFIAKIDNQLQLTAWAGFSRLIDDAFYINSLNTTGSTTYGFTYFNNSQLNIHAELEYLYGEKLKLNAKTDYFTYSISDNQKPWFKPAFLLTVGGSYNIADKIYTKAELYYTGTRTALSINENGSSLKAYADLNLGFDYRYSKVLSIFVQINNLTATRYFKWYNYPSYKLNVMGGLTYSF